MFSGIVTVKTAIKNPAIRFSTEFRPDTQAVSKITIVCEGGHEITSVVHVDDAPTAHAVEDIGIATHHKAVLRLACEYDFVPGEPNASVQDLRSKSDPNRVILVARGTVMTGVCGAVSVITDRPSNEIRNVLEQPSIESDVYFQMFDEAGKSGDQITEFLAYYRIVAATLGEPEQTFIDEFFNKHDSEPPPATPKPPRKTGGKAGPMETVYTRLRNEVGHVRNDPSTNAPVLNEKTRKEISKYVGRLRNLARIAIRMTCGGTSTP